MSRDRLPDPAQEKVAGDFDRFRETYTEQITDAIAFSGLERRFFITVKEDCLLRLTAQYLGDPGNQAALDLGCGIGDYHQRFAAAFKSLSAIDVSEESVRFARAQHPTVDYETYAGGRLPYSDNRFDLVFAICVVHHVPTALWKEFADEMFRVARPGGLAVIIEHNPFNPATQYIVRTCPIDRDAVLLSMSRTRRLLESSGFAIRESRSILSVPPSNRVTCALDRVLGRLPFGAQYFVTGTKP